ncbi:hypothetical protein KIL84_000635 [Mauremys mutica]|uniref:Uncharacterized protein n=1 Tax=Mauremys mutica TaxID=74926 RepID=A0A9D4AV40_9SAUR|nr:hypothetical protein KIL84_000635 [Mauremys mutica]
MCPPSGLLCGVRRMAASPSPPSTSESPQQTPAQSSSQPAAIPIPQLTDKHLLAVRWGIRSLFPRWFRNWDAVFTADTALGPAWISHQAHRTVSSSHVCNLPPEL